MEQRSREIGFCQARGGVVSTTDYKGLDCCSSMPFFVEYTYDIGWMTSFPDFLFVVVGGGRCPLILLGGPIIYPDKK